MTGIVEPALPVALRLVEHFEGLHLGPYLDPVGIATIGLGATRYLDGRAVTLQDPPITRAAAYDMARHHLRSVCVPAVLRLCPQVDTPERLAALADFVFNLGAGRLQASTLRRRVAAGRWDDVPQELSRWVYGGGRVLRGLVLRRQAEAALI